MKPACKSYIQEYEHEAGSIMTLKKQIMSL
jgi:hypothetical protein